MLFMLSPAKSLDDVTPAGDLPHTRPLFTRQSAELIEVLRKQSPRQIAQLMDLSDALAALNVARISFSAKKARGLMARDAIRRRVETPRQLEGFKLEGYRFDANASRPDRMVFRRKTTGV